ncbi:MAG: bifunctional ornithine acetyltransferase/N-acetylglutamate synthase, partial [Methermicoccaceae archaeon]
MVDKKKLESNGGCMSALVVSSGVANAYTGVDGIADARKMTAITSSVLDVPEEEVLVASTGLIGKKLDMSLIEDQIKKVARTLEHSTEGASRAANAILTTDRSAKEIAVVVGEGDSRVKIGAMAKGAGMLEPNMATMLAYVFTDAQLPTATLENLLRDAVDISFNMMTV